MPEVIVVSAGGKGAIPESTLKRLFNRMSGRSLVSGEIFVVPKTQWTVINIAYELWIVFL